LVANKNILHKHSICYGSSVRLSIHDTGDLIKMDEHIVELFLSTGNPTIPVFSVK